MRAEVVEKGEGYFVIKYTAKSVFEGMLMGMIQEKIGYDVALTASSGGGTAASLSIGGTNISLIKDFQKVER